MLATTLVCVCFVFEREGLHNDGFSFSAYNVNVETVSCVGCKRQVETSALKIQVCAELRGCLCGFHLRVGTAQEKVDMGNRKKFTEEKVKIKRIDVE